MANPTIFRAAALITALLVGGQASASDGALAVPGGSLAYESCNAAASPTLILIHDGTLDSGTWDGAFPLLCKSFHTVRFDHRGYGKSPPSSQPYSAVADIGLLMDGLGIQRAILVGASANGGRAATFALDRPDAVEGLVLVGPSIPGAPYSDAFIAKVMPFAQAIGNGDQEAARALAEHSDYLVNPKNPAAMSELHRLLALRTFEAKSLETRGRAILDELPKITQRTLVVVGEVDHPDNRSQAKIAYEKIPGASFVLMRDAGHLPFLEHPAAFAEIVGKFARGQ